ncbi:MAG: hypothetical protein MUP58_02630 [Candidatus Nanohaloarchaeota archaeon QJJ-9]|nr:hypothetical protein [Candidatus Nanohaloarchaeota archaeon QJJ-9]
MDLKVVAAVFITLYGIAIGMAQGNLTTSDLADINTLYEMFQESLRSIGEGTGGFFSSTKPANTTIGASFQYGEPMTLKFSKKVPKVHIKGENARLKVSGLYSNISNLDVRFNNYTGELDFNGNITLDGEFEKVDFGSLPFQADKQQEVKLVVDNPSLLSASKIPNRKFELSSISGVFSSQGKNISLNEDSVKVTSFTGEFGKNFSSGEIFMDGKVFEAELGEGESSISIGG